MTSGGLRQREGARDARVGSMIGPYRIVREIGRGGMGVVYEAVHEAIGQRAAVKLVCDGDARNRDYRNRFENEARTASMVHHPGLAKVFDFGVLEDGTPFILMEFVRGELLRDRLLRLDRLPLAEVVRLTRQIASALAAVHAHGIVHRDLKPENLIVTLDDVAEGGERVKLLDFGIARLNVSPSGRTRPGFVLGTPPYMSPEQCSGSAAIDGASDVYSLGIVAYEMLTGAPPFVGDLPVVMRKHVEEAPPAAAALEGAPEHVRQMLTQMLAKSPEERPTARFVCNEMRTTGRHLTQTAFQTTQASPGVEGSGAAFVGPQRSRSSAPPHASPSPRASAAPGKSGARGGRAAWLLVGAAALAVTALAVRVHRPRPAGPQLTDMVRFAGGELVMGSDTAALDAECTRLGSACRRDLLDREQPPRVVTLDPFFLDVDEVMNADYVLFLRASNTLLTMEDDEEPPHALRYVRERARDLLILDMHRKNSGIEASGGDQVRVRPGFETRPVVQVTWDGARLYCESRGKRLPTEAEWELAARGPRPSSRRYPWGDDPPRCDGVVFGRAADGECAELPPHAEDVHAGARDWTPEHIHGLAGNVSEWVQDSFTLPYYPPCAPCSNPVVEKAVPVADDVRVFRGGGFSNTLFMRTTSRGRWKRGSVASGLGFRCASSEAR